MASGRRADVARAGSVLIVAQTVESTQQDPRDGANRPGAWSDWLESNVEDRICTVPGCSRRILCRGCCQSHWYRLNKYGDPLAGPPYKPKTLYASESDRFWSRVDKSAPNGCWVWTAGKISAGYGTISFGGRDRRTHCVAWEFQHGPVPDGLELDHLCRNRACCNPAHLEPVTHRENLRRGPTLSGINAAKTHCIRGHKLSGSNLFVNKKGHRVCRACKAFKMREYNRIAAERRRAG